LSEQIEIQVTHYGDQPLISVLEANLDLERVVVRRTEYAIKAIFPLQFFIDAASVYLFEKFVLEPVVNPIAEKFNWVNAVKKFLRPTQPFSLVVRINGSEFIEAPLETEHEITAEIWNIIKKTLDVLRSEGLLDRVSKIRFTPDDKGELLIVCYEQNRPTRVVNLDKKQTNEVSGTGSTSQHIAPN
jgi:hypothetical protein